MDTVERLLAAGEILSPAVRAALVALEADNRNLRSLLENAQARIHELEHRLGMNSTNSSKPPSSDPPGTVRAKKEKQKERRRKGERKRRRGAQPGHAAHQRALVPPGRVDRVVEHWPEQCAHCGLHFALFEQVGMPERRQMIELPPVRAEVVEHRLERVRCMFCGKTTKAGAPADVGEGTNFGPRLVAFCAAVTVRLRASRRNLHRLLCDLLDVEPPCVGTLQHLLEETSRAVLPAYREVRQALRKSAAAGADETTWRLRRLLYWLWVGANQRLSFYRLARSRSRRESERLLGKGYAGVVTTDRYAAYNGLSPGQRQLCWAHLARTFEAWSERGGVAGRLGRWARAETARMFSLWHRFQKGEITRTELGRRLRPLQARFTRLLYAAYHSGDPKLVPTADQLLGPLWDALWTFAVHEEVEPTNNTAEQALRCAVIWKKTSFGSKSGQGLRLTERLLTVAETAKKQQRDLLGFLAQAITAHRLHQPPPSLIARA